MHNLITQQNLMTPEERVKTIKKADELISQIEEYSSDMNYKFRQDTQTVTEFFNLILALNRDMDRYNLNNQELELQFIDNNTDLHLANIKNLLELTELYLNGLLPFLTDLEGLVNALNNSADDQEKAEPAYINISDYIVATSGGDLLPIDKRFN